MTRPFGYGIVGCGWVAAAHAWGVRALAGEGVRLIAVADRDRGRAEALASRFDVDRVHEDFRDLLADEEVDAVSICLPDFLHRDAVLAAARAGKHVLCEKPLALDVDEADEMVAACRDSERVLSLVMNHRYSPDNIRLKRAVQDGALGRILIGSVVHSSALTGNDDGSSPWRGRRGRAAGGILTTQAIHFLDLLLWFAGPVAAVKAWNDNLTRPDLDFEDTGAVALRLRSGAMATLVTTNGTPIMDDFTGTRIELHGTEGYAMLEGDELRLSAFRDDYDPPPVRQPAPPAGADEVFGHGHIHEIADFVRAARGNGPVPVAGADARHLMAVLSAAYRSAAEQWHVELEPDDEAYADAATPRPV